MGKLDRLRDDEVEQLLDGTYVDPDLVDLSGALDALRSSADPIVTEDAIARYVSNAVPTTLRPSRRVRRSIPLPKSRQVRVLRRPAVVGAISALTLIVGMSGVAWAANGSKPGDSLYGIDRAFEAIGIGDGGSAERLSEIRALFDAGDLALMLDSVNSVIPGNGAATESAADALKAAAQSVANRGSTASSGTLLAFSELLDYLSTNLDGVDAAEISNFAGHIRTRGFEPPDAGLTPADPTDPAGFREDG